MTPANQDQLLERNTPLYVQFRLGSFLARNHIKVEEAASEEDIPNIPSSNFINFRHLENSLKFFRSGVDLDEYQHLVSDLRCLRNATRFEESAIIAYIVLFGSSDELRLDLLDGFEDVRLMNEIIFDSHITSTDNEFEIQNLYQILRNMGIFCTYNIDWDALMATRYSDIARKNIAMSYTQEEEAWMERQLKQFDQAFRSVEVGMDLINEFVMHCLGVPLSKTFFPTGLVVMLERIRRLLNQHPEFEEMAVTTQRNFLRKNCGHALALYVVRSENLSGMEQIREGLGELDEKAWTANYGSLFDTPDKFAKASIVNAVHLKAEEWLLFSELLSSATILALDPVMFKLNLLLSLTEPLGDNQSPCGLTSLHFKYKMILKRRLKWKPDWFGSQGGTTDPDLLVERIFSRRQCLSRLNALIEKVMTPSN